MTKEEKIKEVYGYFFKLCYVDCDGYSEDAILYFYPDELDLKIYYEKDNDFKTNLFRPKSLSGIENNNRWIKIESESDLPKERTLCYFIHEKEIISGRYDKKFECPYGVFGWKTITHYQPIKKPEPPIY